MADSADFNRQFYYWCIAQMHEEVNSSFATLREMKNPYTLTEILTLEKFPQEQQYLILQAALKQMNSKAFSRSDELAFLSKQEDFLLKAFQSNYSRYRRSTTGSAHLFSEESKELYKQFSKKSLKRVMEDYLSKLFEVKPERYGNDLRYSIKLRNWLLTTDISIEKNNYSYGHQMYSYTNDSTFSQLFSGPIYFPRYIGFIHGSTWCFYNDSDVAQAAEIITLLCRRFIKFALDHLDQ